MSLGRVPVKVISTETCVVVSRFAAESVVTAALCQFSTQYIIGHRQTASQRKIKTEEWRKNAK